MTRSVHRGFRTRIRHVVAADGAKGRFGIIARFDVGDDRLNIYRGLGVSRVVEGFMRDFARMTVIFCRFHRGSWVTRRVTGS